MVNTVDLQFASKTADEVIDVTEWLQRHVRGLKTNMDKWNCRDSGLEFVGFNSAKAKVTLLQDFSGEAFFTLPKALKSKTAVINVDTASHCFKYAVLSILHYHDLRSASHRDRVTQYAEWEQELDFEGRVKW